MIIIGIYLRTFLSDAIFVRRRETSYSYNAEQGSRHWYHFNAFGMARPRLEMIIISLDPLRAKKTFIRKKLGHTMVSAIKASSVTL